MPPPSVFRSPQGRLFVRCLCTLLLVTFGPAETGHYVRGNTSSEGADPQVRLPDLEHRLVDPVHEASAARATVVLFLSTDCPISNRYAPEMRRLHETFASRGVMFWLVYPNPAESLTAIREHLDAFGYPGRALRDPEHALVQLAGATVTSEVAVLDSHGRFAYRGRIDNRYADFGVDRQAPTRHDLEEALTAVVAGKTVPEPSRPAVGCFLADLR